MFKIFLTFVSKQATLNEEVNCSEYSRLVSVPWSIALGHSLDLQKGFNYKGRLQPWTLSIKALSTMTLSIHCVFATLSITTFSIMTLSKKTLFATLSTNDAQHNNTLP
jgi:hypothetical protein